MSATPAAASTLPPVSAARRGLRVLFVTNAWPHAARPGSGAHAEREVAALREAGVDIEVVPIHGFLDRRAYARAALDLARTNRRPDFDLVHAFLGHAGAVSRMHVRRPLVITFTGSDVLGDRRDDGPATRKSRIEAAVFRQVARTAAATITCAPHMALALPPSVQARNHVVPTSVPLDRFRPRERAEVRAELGWPADEPVVLFAADPARPVKNHPLAVAAVERLARDVPEARLRVSAGVPWEEMPRWMAAADVVLMTSRSEGSPAAVREAMACETPVVSVPVGDVAGLLAGVPGCAVRPPDPEALAEGLRLALAHGRSPEARAAVAPFDMGPTAQRTIAIYEHVLGRRAAPAPPVAA